MLDATTGQNGLTQARVFADVVDVTGIVLTKLDGTAKGGIVFRVQRELGVPVKLVGLGEGPDDLAPFEPAAFVDALLDVTPVSDAASPTDTLRAGSSPHRVVGYIRAVSNVDVTLIALRSPTGNISRVLPKHVTRRFPPTWPTRRREMW